MTYYTQLREFERVEIYRGLSTGLTLEMIGRKLGRSKSTISRELARNSDHIGYLYPRDAQKRTDDRKARYGYKLDRNDAVRAYIVEKLTIGWAPVAIAGRWNLEHSAQTICAETIYQYVYHPKNRELELWKLLPRSKKKRGFRRQRQTKGNILHRVSIHERPNAILARKEAGHFEADLMFNKGSQSANVLALVERRSRLVFLAKHSSKHSKPIMKNLKKMIGKIAASCTFDNGSEFALHHQIGIPTYFCDPGKPWQKGSVEKINAQLRRYLPFNMTHDKVTQQSLDRIAFMLNNTPRKILGFLTPHEVYINGGE